MAWRDREGWLNLVFLGDVRVEQKKARAEAIRADGGNHHEELGLREFRVRFNRPSPIRQVHVLIWRELTPIRGLPNLIRQVIPLISHIHSYPPYHSHLHPPSLSFLSTTQSSSQDTKLSHSTLSLHDMIMIWHRVQHPPEIVCLPFIRMSTSWPLNVESVSSVRPYTIDRHPPTLYESS